MANPEHVEIVRRGKEVIDEWREFNTDVRLDLTAVDLNNSSLSGANLSGAGLFCAALPNADLTYADLSMADLVGADLRATYLCGAKLYRTNFGRTAFGHTDLTDAEGLETCRHITPSYLDHSTIQISGGLPEIFIRGCGWSDVLIATIPALLNDPIQFYSCFISYSTRDEEFAKRLHADLQDSGVRCWFAPEDLKIDDRVLSTIDEAIRLRDKLVLILSKSSIESDWVEHEANKALEEEERRGTPVLFPIRIDGAVMKTEFGWAKRIREAHRPTGRHIGDFSHWKDPDSYKTAFDRLMRDLKEERRA